MEDDEKFYAEMSYEQHDALQALVKAFRAALEVELPPGRLLTELDAVMWDEGWEITPDPSKESFRRRRGHG